MTPVAVMKTKPAKAIASTAKLSVGLRIRGNVPPSGGRSRSYRTIVTGSPSRMRW
jgi:hypothetical protein